jgi:5-enolpyruvylshikimate-3-phosphate synthase
VTGHSEPVRQVCLIPQSQSQTNRVLLAAVSSNQLTIHRLSTEDELLV